MTFKIGLGRKTLATTQGQAVSTVNIKGKEYVQVAERVKVALTEDYGYEILYSESFTVGERALVRVTVRVNNGKTYVGTSEAKLNAKPGTADGDAPFECAETSALGRALGFAGIGVIDSIASADEVNRAISNPKRDTVTRTYEEKTYQPKPVTEDIGHAKTLVDGENPPSDPQLNSLVKNGIPDSYLKGLTFGDAKKLMNDAKNNGWKYPWQTNQTPKSAPKAPVAPTNDYPDDDIPF